MLASLLITSTLAAPLTLPEVTVRPLEPVVRVEPIGAPAPPGLAPPSRFVERMPDPGRVTMLLSTVDTPPEPLRDEVAHESGQSCVLTVTVRADGRAVNPRIVDCTGSKAAARRRARAIEFRPAQYRGESVAVVGVPVTVWLAARR